MDDGQRSLAGLLHPKAGPRRLLVVIKHTDWKARYVRVFMVQQAPREHLVDITKIVADALRLDMFDPDMERADDYGYVLQHSGSLMLRIHPHDQEPGKESPGAHVERKLVDELNKLARCTPWAIIGALKIKII